MEPGAVFAHLLALSSRSRHHRGEQGAQAISERALCASRERAWLRRYCATFHGAIRGRPIRRLAIETTHKLANDCRWRVVVVTTVRPPL